MPIPDISPQTLDVHSPTPDIAPQSPDIYSSTPDIAPADSNNTVSRAKMLFQKTLREAAPRGTAALKDAYFLGDCPPVGEGISGVGEGISAGTGKHLVVCVHGMSGNEHDLRLFTQHLKIRLPHLQFFMSSSNQSNTHANFNHMANNFAAELKGVLQKENPVYVSIFAHSLGNIIVRTALCFSAIRALFQPSGVYVRSSHHALLGKPILLTYVSLSGPHTGVLGMPGLVSAGLWFYSKWKRSESLLALKMSDSSNPHTSHLFTLSLSDGKNYPLLCDVTTFSSVTSLPSPL